jgi:hypothetical protein
MLVRQRRIRLLNERTYAATQERSARVEGLVAEMRTDLKSLKNRLGEELTELGINEEAAEDIMASFYREQDTSSGYGDAMSPPKFQRRMLRPTDDDMADESADAFSDRLSNAGLSGDELDTKG